MSASIVIALERCRPAFRRAVAAWPALALALLFGCFRAAGAADDFLEPERAFSFEARVVDDRRVEAVFKVAPGYYLYREQFRFASNGAVLGEPVLPAGKVKFDDTFQKDVETYRDEVRVAVPVQSAGRDFRLVVTSQGCADAGLCYPPMQSAADVSLAGFGGSGSARVVAADAPLPDAGAGRAGAASFSAAVAPAADAARAVAPNPIESALHGGSFWLVVAAFFGAGILLSLTPCVLPMLPIVSSIIVGQGASVSRARGFTLAVAYSLGMAIVYTALGVAAGLAGEGFAAALQNPWALGVFATGLVALALSMFGAYELRLPSAFTGRVAAASNRLPAGRLAGVGAMGGVSALIVSPCVAAPLAGALLYLGQTRDVWLGGSALFSLAAGMSVPLLLVGASAGAWLPRAGAWMNDVKSVFGVLLLGVALWTLQTVLPAPLVLALWGTLALGSAVLALNGVRRGRPRARAGAVPTGVVRVAVGAVLALAGLLEWVGAASGGSDPLQPLAHLAGRSAGTGADASPLRFGSVRSVDELDAALRGAGRPAMLDFYADWCVSCKEMERYTFSDPAVRARLGGALLLKADVTRNTPADKALLKRYNLFGPPGTIFFDARGNEVAGTRVIGYQNASRFLATLQSAGL